MNVLYVGDVMGRVGLETVERILPDLKREKSVDFVVAQAENLTEGRGVSEEDFKRLRRAGVDFCSGGNWSLFRSEIIPALNDPTQPIIRPANYPAGTPGLGYKRVQTNAGNVLVVSLLGHVVGRDADKPFDNPLQVIDSILEAEKEVQATIVNFHGDFSSEKVVIGHYLDGRASMVVGDHWHVPTADARILPGGTAHMTDVGMCGSLDSSLGVRFDSIIPRWKDGASTRNVLEEAGTRQFNALLAQIDAKGLASQVEHIRIILD
jgi:metallophosphoesterase (TIGR00282 family)